jgi:hypothetical protein
LPLALSFFLTMSFPSLYTLHIKKKQVFIKNKITDVFQ